LAPNCTRIIAAPAPTPAPISAPLPPAGGHSDQRSDTGRRRHLAGVVFLLNEDGVPCGPSCAGTVTATAGRHATRRFDTGSAPSRVQRARIISPGLCSQRRIGGIHARSCRHHTGRYCYPPTFL
jgi:hypothetical protein